ncbi:MAG TPA: ERCC4 domain-containing protein [Gammaproteobacteria bacterium]|nr:ERCC4 domain-containing protein [Gammaproteobacteria bacterium]
MALVADRIPILVDDRECRSGVVQALHASGGFDVSVQRLPVGDYLVDDRFLFERKSLPDLALSIQSGRLFKQVLRLARVEQLRPVMVLEGTSGDLRDCGMGWESIQGALVTISMFVGLPVLRTRSASETARTLLYTARQGRTVVRGAVPRGGHRPKGKTALQRHLLQGLPGVGPGRANRLLDRFGSVRAVLTADEAALASVPGVGLGTARKIVWSVEETTAPYISGAASL